MRFPSICCACLGNTAHLVFVESYDARPIDLCLGRFSESARRIGINVLRIQFFVYVYVGMLAGLAGIIHGSMSRMADPFSLVGQELSVIAAVVLGGARLIGGYGTLTGTS